MFDTSQPIVCVPPGTHIIRFHDVDMNESIVHERTITHEKFGTLKRHFIRAFFERTPVPELRGSSRWLSLTRSQASELLDHLTRTNRTPDLRQQFKMVRIGEGIQTTFEFTPIPIKQSRKFTVAEWRLVEHQADFLTVAQLPKD